MPDSKSPEAPTTPAPKVTKLRPAGREEMMRKAVNAEFDEVTLDPNMAELASDPAEARKLKAQIRDDLDINKPHPIGRFDKPKVESIPEDTESPS